MKAFVYLAAGALLVGGTALGAQQTQTPSAQDQSVYQQQNPQDRTTDQQGIRNRDRHQNWSRDQQVHRDRDRDQNRTNGQYADQDRDRVNEYNQYDNGQNGTLSDQDRNRDRDRDQNGYIRQDQNEYSRHQDDERTYGYSGIPQNDQHNSSMTWAQRSAWRDGIQAGRADRQSGRAFSPARSANRYRGAGQDERQYREAYRQGYQRGYYGNNSNRSPYEHD